MAPLTLVTRRLSLLVVAATAAFGLAASMAAQTPATATGADVEVRSVKFATVRPPGGGDAWLEASVELGVTAIPAAGVDGRFADRVRVTLNLSVRKRDNDFEFFRASAEAVSLEAGRAVIRFYLPPEVLRREQINSDPFAYMVEVAVGGRAVPGGAGSVSAVLRSAEVVRAFKDRITQGAVANDGVMVPQYLSPFAFAYPSDTPSFVRRER